MTELGGSVHQWILTIASALLVNGMVRNEATFRWEGLALSCFLPGYRSSTKGMRESLVPVCLSATHIAYGSIRMEPVFMVLGQSAPLPHAWPIDKKSSIQDIDVKELQNRLSQDP